MNAQAVSELYALSALLGDRAARIEASADVLAARVATAAWAGPAADRFRALMAERRNEMRVAADALRRLASAAAGAGGGAA